MKRIVGAMAAVLSMVVLTTACKKDKKEPDETGLYYFNFKANGSAFNFNSDLPQFPSTINQLIGSQMVNNTNKPNISLGFRYDHNPTEAEVLNLAGRTFYFDGTFPHPVLMFDGGALAGNEQYHSIDTLSALYNVKINSISFKRTDSTEDNMVDVYVINGTCKARLANNQDTTLRLDITDANFNFLVARTK